MRICRFSLEEELHFGLLEGEGIVVLAGHPFAGLEPAGRVVGLAEVRLAAPVLPSKVIAIGRNYSDHAAEFGNQVPAEPMVFLKPSTSVIGPGDPIRLPWQSEHVDHEAELAIVIGRLCRDVPAANAAEVILGYTCANDVSARDLQKADGQWGRAKGFDSFCPLGPWIQTEVDLDEARITCTVNGAVRQDASLGDLVHDVPRLVEFVSSVMTLVPGDVILTGTPAGVGPIVAGDSVTVAIEGIGELTNPVVDRG